MAYSDLYNEYAKTGNISTFLDGVKNLFGLSGISCGAIITQSGVSYGTYSVGPPVYLAAGAQPPGSTCSWAIFPPDPPKPVVVLPAPVVPLDARRQARAKDWVEQAVNVVQAPYVYSPGQACALAERVSKTYRGLSGAKLVTFPWRFPIQVGGFVTLQQQGQKPFSGYCYALEWNATGNQVTKTAMLMEYLDA